MLCAANSTSKATIRVWAKKFPLAWIIDSCSQNGGLNDESRFAIEDELCQRFAAPLPV